MPQQKVRVAMGRAGSIAVTPERITGEGDSPLPVFRISGECRYGVCPRLQPAPDRLVRIGGEAHAVPAEVHVVALAVGVVALQGCRVLLAAEVPGGGPAKG